jgi:hypothetical protein
MQSKSYTVLGYIIIITVIFRLFLLKRTGFILANAIDILHLTLGLSMIISQIISIILILKQIKPNKKEITVGIMQRIIEICIIKPVDSFIDSILATNQGRAFARGFSVELTVIIRNKLCLYLFTIYFFLLPKIMMSLILYADIFILNSIKGYFMFIWIFGITFLMQMMLQISNRYVLKELLNIEHLYVDKVNSNNNIIQFKSNSNLNIQDQWISLYNSRDILNAINLVKSKKWFLILLLIITLVFLSAWGWYIKIIMLNINKQMLKIIRNPNDIYIYLSI